MSNYIRPKIPGARVFFTVNLSDRGAQTLVDHIGVLREAVRVTKAERPFGIDAWVVLPDHMHCVWTLPDGDADYSGRMAAIKARFTAGLRRSGFRPTLSQQNGYGARGGRVRVAEGGVGLKPDLQGGVRRGNEAPIWQKRFWEHHIRDQAALAACVRYCWINPVKHGVVGHPGEWPYSSWHRDGGGDAMLSGAHFAHRRWALRRGIAKPWCAEAHPTLATPVHVYAGRERRFDYVGGVLPHH